MISRNEVIELAEGCVFDIVEPDEYHDKREIVDSGNLWITERRERFASDCYRKGVEDSAKVCLNDYAGLSAYFAQEIRKLLEDTCQTK